jgi:hypothetical protein
LVRFRVRLQMHGSLPIEPHIVVCFGNSVKDEKRDCGSKVRLKNA